MFQPAFAPARTAAILLALSTPALAQWLQRSPGAAPTARVGAAMTFDGTTGAMLLFGGGDPFLDGETWIYDGTIWVQLTPVTSPSARFGAQLVYDAARSVSVLYGGLASNISIPPPNSDTWEWDGTTWTQATPAGNAGPRYYYGACYDLGRARTVIYGGMSTQLLGPPNNQTWEYDGTTWTQIATVGNPGGRERPAMCFHAGIGKAVLFGGSDGSNVTNTTWLYDGTTWTQVPVAGSVPPARNAASMTYDSVRGVCVLTGGQDASGVFSDTWTFDGTTWTQQPFTTQGVRDHALAFLPTTKQVVKFGGFVSAPNTLSSETWEFGSGVYGQGCPGSNGVPALIALGTPQIGQPWTVGISGLNPAFNLGILAFGFTKLPGIDLTFVLNMPGCFAFTTADILLTAPGAAGSATWSWPAVTGLAGDAFYTQALSLDPAINGFGFTISNAIYATIGN
jgi:hypothetical protein